MNTHWNEDCWISCRIHYGVYRGSIISSKRAFKTAPKGMQFLRTYNQMGELVIATNAATKKPGSESLF
jgi:hypothetical protein